MRRKGRKAGSQAVSLRVQRVERMGLMTRMTLAVYCGAGSREVLSFFSGES